MATTPTSTDVISRIPRVEEKRAGVSAEKKHEWVNTLVLEDADLCSFIHVWEYEGFLCEVAITPEHIILSAIL